MDIRTAREIVSALAEGIDPLTGEVLPNDHVCNQAEVVRVLYALLKAAEPIKERTLPDNAGKPWTLEADRELKGLFENGESVSALSRAFRTYQKCY